MCEHHWQQYEEPAKNLIGCLFIALALNVAFTQTQSRGLFHIRLSGYSGQHGYKLFH
jgi:hypothetical protein